MKVVIRPLRSEHWPELIDLWVVTWQQAMPQIDFEWRREWLKGYLPELEAKGFELMGAFGDKDTVMGFIAINPQTQILDQIAVAVGAKGKGVASALMQVAREHSPSGIILNVNVDNARAIHFYEKQGFHKTGITGLSPRSKLPFLEMMWPL